MEVSDTWGPCLTCYWHQRNKQAKSGQCAKSKGRIVSDPTLEITRTAYPITVCSEGCEEHRVKP